MSTSDQDQDQNQRRDADVPIAGAPTADVSTAGVPTAGVPAAGAAAAERDTERDAQDGPEGQDSPNGRGGQAGQDGPAGQDGQDGQDGKRLTPRQARQLRIVLSSAGMAAMAVVLALRIASRSSVLVVGVYGLALILCGVVIELSRNGRTRLGSWLLGAGLVAAVGADWLLLP